MSHSISPHLILLTNVMQHSYSNCRTCQKHCDCIACSGIEKQTQKIHWCAHNTHAESDIQRSNQSNTFKTEKRNEELDHASINMNAVCYMNNKSEKYVYMYMYI